MALLRSDRMTSITFFKKPALQESHMIVSTHEEKATPTSCETSWYETTSRFYTARGVGEVLPTEDSEDL